MSSYPVSEDLQRAVLALAELFAHEDRTKSELVDRIAALVDKNPFTVWHILGKRHLGRPSHYGPRTERIARYVELCATTKMTRQQLAEELKVCCRTIDEYKRITGISAPGIAPRGRRGGGQRERQLGEAAKTKGNVALQQEYAEARDFQDKLKHAWLYVR